MSLAEALAKAGPQRTEIKLTLLESPEPMSAPVFTLTVPADPSFRSIACEVVGRYVDLVGGSEPERAAFESAFVKAVDDLVGSGDVDVELSCLAQPPGFEIRLRCGGRSAVVSHPVPASQR